MENRKKIGIWMDHSEAHLIKYANDTIKVNTIESTFTHQDKEYSLSKSESLMHNKRQQQQGKYYKELADIIENYTEALLFGPTNAKVELLNILRADLKFENIKIEVKHSDKMTKNQQHAFVKKHFI
jgi:nitrogenase subunit NifH